MALYKNFFVKIQNSYEFLLMLAARLVACFVNGRNVWLIAEKTSEARDNGYWLYHYIRSSHSNVKAYYVINRNSADYNKIVFWGEKFIIYPSSFKFRVWFWSAQYCAMSQPQSDYSSAYRQLKKFNKKYQVRVFLQHGITKDNLPHSFDCDKSGFDVFVTAALPEQDSIMQRHGYNSKTCPLLGFCRFDNLKVNHKQSHTILVMPTFRHWLMSPSSELPSEEEKEKFRNEDYCKTYKSLLLSDKINDLLVKYDYTLLFYPHYCAQPFLDCFDDSSLSNRVILASKNNYDVQNLLIESDILITDFSSIFFDFAYMKKPEIFYQFDEERYRQGHYEEGYFKYREHAFGPVVETEDKLIDYLSLILKNNAQMEEQYKIKVDEFFAYRDQNNCSRTYNYIMNVKK